MTGIPSPNALRLLAELADGRNLKAVMRAKGLSQAAGSMCLSRAVAATGVSTTYALLALAVDEKWIVRTFEGWIVPDGGDPS